MHPGSLRSVWFGKRCPQLQNLAAFLGEGTLGKALADFVRAQWNRQFSWDDVKRIRKEWKGPLVIKGVMYVDYARLAREASADGIVVSIHDGRQFDISPTTMDVLEEIASTP